MILPCLTTSGQHYMRIDVEGGRRGSVPACAVNGNLKLLKMGNLQLPLTQGASGTTRRQSEVRNFRLTGI